MDPLVWRRLGLGIQVALTKIDRSPIEKLPEVKCTETNQSNSNRTMALLRIVLRKAHRKWEWLDKAPTVPMYRIERAEPVS